MKPTPPTTLVGFAIVGVVLGMLLDTALAAAGEPVVVPPYPLGLVLLVLAMFVVLAAVPVRRAVRDGPKARVDPFYAARVVVLAKASALTGALLGGGGLGIVLYLLSRPVVSGPAPALMALATAGGGLALLIGALIAERMCTVPPEDDDEPKGPTGAAPA